MRPISIKLMSVIGLMVTLFIFAGCGGGDLLDEVENRYHATMIFEDNEEETFDIDVVRTGDCDGDLTTDDPEPFTGFHIILTVESDTTALTGDTFNVERYTMNFRPNHGAYSTAGGSVGVEAADMPDLADSTLNPLIQNTSLLVQPGTAGAEIELPAWTWRDKFVYGSIVTAMPAFADVANTAFVYDVQVVLDCRNGDDETFTITTPWTPLNFAGYNNCD